MPRSSAPDRTAAHSPTPDAPASGAPASGASTTDASTTRAFAELGLPARLVDALARRDLHVPFAIQTVAVPDALAGRDVLGRASTGSGKTLAFGLPMIARLAGRRAAPRRPLGLVLVPTRELAMQVLEVIEPLGRSLGLGAKLVVGGQSFPRQIDALARGTEIVVATPGRLVDHVKQGTADLADVEIAVLDEADHMADMGFLPDVSWLLDLVRPGGQRLLFSATLDRDVDTLVRRYLDQPVTHSVGAATASVTTMDHHILRVAPKDKQAVTARIGARAGRTMMFVRTKLGADRVAEQLCQAGVRAAALHGGKTQAIRTRTLAEFRDGTVPVLVATDVAARGIHVDGVSLVLHVDPPADAKDYLHRAGRTARAGESGTVATLVLPHQARGLDGLTAQAGVAATLTRVAPEDGSLARITGAQQPSGEPVVVDLAPRPRRGRESGGRGFGRGGRDTGGRAGAGRGPRAGSYAPRRGGDRYAPPSASTSPGAARRPVPAGR